MCAFGINQNYHVYPDGESMFITGSYLYEASKYTGAGEWLPIDTSRDIVEMTAGNKVYADGKELEFFSDGSVRHHFTISDEISKEYEVPLIYYKGYRAYIVTKDGEKVSLTLRKGNGAKIIVSNPDGKRGEVTVEYHGTIIQKISLGITIIPLCLMILVFVRKKDHICTSSKVRCLREFIILFAGSFIVFMGKPLIESNKL